MMEERREAAPGEAAQAGNSTREARGDLPGLLAALGDEDPRVRWEAVEALGGRREPQAIDALLRALGDEQPFVRWEAAVSLAQLASGGPRWWPWKRGPDPSHRLMEALRSPDARVCAAAADAFGFLRDERAVEPLARMLADADPEARLSAAEALGYLGSAEAVPALKGTLGDASPAVRRAAVEALGRIASTDLAGELAGALEDPDVLVRRAAAQALKRLGDPQAAGPLARALRDRDPQVRRRAADGLADLGDPSALGELERLASREWRTTDAPVKKAARRAIGRIHRRQRASSAAAKITFKKKG